VKRQTVEKVIRTKMDAWLESIKDEKVRALAKKNVIVTGGCITSMFLREKINDFDVYFADLKTTYAVAKYYAEQMMEDRQIPNRIQTQICVEDEKDRWFSIDNLSDDHKAKMGIPDNFLDTYAPTADQDIKYRVRCYIKSAGEVGNPEDQGADVDEEIYPTATSDSDEPIAPHLDEIDETESNSNKFKPIYITSNAITLSHKVQIVIRFYGKPDVIHSNYDFKHVTNYWTYDTGLVTNARALECILSKELVYVGSRYPLASIIRMRKFIARGWTCNAGQIIKMAMQLNDMDLTNPYTLEAQLTGVDVAYTHGAISMLQKKLEENQEIDVKAYFLRVIEKIFDGRKMEEDNVQQ